MEYKILDNGNLRITAEAEERVDLHKLRAERREANESFGTTADEADALEKLIANSELDWLPEGSTGDLTSAPMLGIYGEPQPLNALTARFGERVATHGSQGAWYEPITARWAFMDYQVKSFLDDMIFQGYADFQGGYAHEGYKTFPTVTIENGPEVAS